MANIAFGWTTYSDQVQDAELAAFIRAVNISLRGLWQDTQSQVLYKTALPSTWSAISGFSATNRRFLLQDGTAADSPTWGQVTAADVGSGAALTEVNDTNVTLTLGGTPASALLAATSLTVGWTGTLAAGRLNGSVVQGITNDTNVTGSIAAQVLTLGWTGTLGLARGGTNADLSATGGAANYLKQAGAGSAITVGTIPQGDVVWSGTANRCIGYNSGGNGIRSTNFNDNGTSCILGLIGGVGSSNATASAFVWEINGTIAGQATPVALHVSSSLTGFGSDNVYSILSQTTMIAGTGSTAYGLRLTPTFSGSFTTKYGFFTDVAWDYALYITDGSHITSITPAGAYVGSGSINIGANALTAGAGTFTKVTATSSGYGAVLNFGGDEVIQAISGSASGDPYIAFYQTTTGRATIGYDHTIPGISITNYAGSALAVKMGALTSGAITASGLVLTPASATGGAGFRLPSGTAPTSPVSGDFWYDGTNLKFRDGVTTRTLTWV